MVTSCKDGLFCNCSPCWMCGIWCIAIAEIDQGFEQRAKLLPERIIAVSTCSCLPIRSGPGPPILSFSNLAAFATHRALERKGPIVRMHILIFQLATSMIKTWPAEIDSQTLWEHFLFLLVFEDSSSCLGRLEWSLSHSGLKLACSLSIWHLLHCQMPTQIEQHWCWHNGLVESCYIPNNLLPFGVYVHIVSNTSLVANWCGIIVVFEST